MSTKGVRGTRALLAAAMLAGALTARAQTEWFVATNGVDNADTGRGLSWTLPFATISNAVAHAATAGDIVTVSNGLYEIDAEIVVDRAITVRSYSGDPATTVVKRRASGSNLPRHRIFSISNVLAQVSGFTITNGQAEVRGSGIYLHAGTVSNCVVTGNIAGSYADAYGGGLFMATADALLVDSIVENNEAQNRYRPGGGIYAAAGTILRCTVRNNKTTTMQQPGGGIWASGTNVVIRKCVIHGNRVGSSQGAGVAGGTIENSLIFDNITTSGRGGGVVGGNLGSGHGTTWTVLRNSRVFENHAPHSTTGQGGGVYSGSAGGVIIVNSTIHDNISRLEGGGVYNATVTNSIVYFNRSTDTDDDNYFGGTFSHSCTTPLPPADDGNISADPRFADPLAANYQPASDSPCTDTGLTVAAPGETDLAGNPRIVNGTVDMGAYEYGTTLAATFTANPTYGSAPFSPSFTAVIYGGNTNGADYAWDFNNDGTYTETGTDKQTVSPTYTEPGIYSVKLRVSNGASEEAVTVRTNYISVGGVHYVSLDGGHNPPFASWDDAATNIQAAVDAALPGATIMVNSGTFLIDTEIAVTNAMTIRSLNGPAHTTVRRRTAGTGNPQHRIFNLSAAGSTLSGIRIENGYGALGAGAFVFNSVVTNCVVVSNGLANVGGDTYSHGGGLRVEGSGSLVVDCIIEYNSSTAQRGNGAGIFITGGVIDRCIIRYNTRSGTWEGNGSGVRVATVFAEPIPIIRNCLIYGNTGSNVNGGGVAGGIVENCTVVSNTASGTGGGVNGATVVNSIVYDNTSLNTASHNYSDGSFSYACTTPLPAGDGNIDSDPMLANFRPLFGSPAIDSGTNLAWMADATDLDGNPRVLNDTVDMGAFEFDAASAPLAVTFSGGPLLGYESLQVVFTSSVVGATGGLGYAWDFGDGAPDLTGPSLAVVTNTFGPGQYTVRVTVTNSFGETDSQTRTDYVLVKTANPIFVSTNGANVQPYANWGHAATNLARAVTLAATGTVVSVSNGVYGVAAELTLAAPFAIIGVNGPDVTTVRRTGAVHYRVFKVNAAGALLTGFTIRDGSAFGEAGSGVAILSGTVSNCLIVANNAPSSGNSYGGGVFLGGTDALLTHSTIVSNTTQQRYYGGGGIYATAGEVRNCKIAFNTTPMQGNGGGVLASAGVAIRNCLIRNNTAGAWAYGGGVSGGVVENCTVVTNTADYNGGGVYGSTVTNSIIAFNKSNTTADHNWSGGSFAFSCTTPLPAGTGNTADDPLFIRAATNNYRLIFGSPAIDSGTNLAWMTEATDLDGHPRILDGTVDMGAFEFDAATAPLGVAFSGAPLLGHESLQVVFTSSIVGDTTGLSYAWDFGDGISGPDQAVVTNTYGPGQYTVSVTVNNGNEETATQTRTDYVLVRTSNPIFVSTNGANVQPYATWANAATNLYRAFALATTGSVVSVSNGVYNLSGEMLMDFPGTLVGVNGRDVTTVRRSGSGFYRLLTIAHADAVARGLTFTGGSTYLADGGGVYMTAGMLRDCAVTNCAAQGQGGGIYMTGGIVTNSIARDNQSTSHGGGIAMHGAGTLLVDSTIDKNRCTGRYGGGGGVYVNSGTVRRCTISGNTVAWDTLGAGIRAAAGVLIENCVISDNAGLQSPVSGGGVSGGRLRNCLIVGNTTPSYGGGAYGSALESCTVVSNRSTNADSGDGGGVYGGTATNSIVYFNWSVRGTHNYHGSPVFAYSCTTPDPGGPGNITGDPLFVAADGGDFRLRTRGTISPCIDAGITLGWMAAATDLDGHPRLANKGVDMGAYENEVAPAGTAILFR